MKYTRYNYKNKKDKGMKSMAFFITVILLAVILGTMLAKFIFTGNLSSVINDIGNVKGQESNISEEDGNSKLHGTFEIIQCGYYSKEEYALETQKKVNGTIPVYIIKDGDKFRVISGIYQVDKGEEDKNKIAALGVQTVRLKIDIQGETYYDSLIYGLIDGYMKIFDGLKDNKVKTEEFKKWAAAFEEKGERANDIKTIKEHINNLPAELTKDKIPEEIAFLSNLLLPYKSS